MVFKDCVITAFNGGGIYKSCDGLNIGGNGNTIRTYQGRKVYKMTVQGDKLRTVFETIGNCYLDPSGEHPAGDPARKVVVTRC